MSNTGTNRRRFLNYCTDVVMAVLGLFLAVPAVAYFLGPLWARREEEGTEAGFVDAGRVAALPLGEWRLVSLEVVQQEGWKKSRVKHSVWVRRRGKGDQEITVLSPICPHLGCPINYQPDQARFFCPCHGGIFDPNGRHTAGPPPRSMDPLAFEVRKGRLWVRWQDFKPDVPGRIPVQA